LPEVEVFQVKTTDLRPRWEGVCHPRLERQRQKV
jgi:hypothetical protein